MLHVFSNSTSSTNLTADVRTRLPMQRHQAIPKDDRILTCGTECIGTRSDNRDDRFSDTCSHHLIIACQQKTQQMLTNRLPSPRNTSTEANFTRFCLFSPSFCQPASHLTSVARTNNQTSFIVSRHKASK